MKRYSIFLIGSALGVVTAMSPALAQASSPVGAGDGLGAQSAISAADTQDANDQSSSRLEDIVVTARKRARAEELQRTPTSITAISAAQLQRSTTRDLIDIGRMVPSAALQPSAQKGVQNFSIRGMGVSGTSPSDEPAVGIIQDGVYWGTNYGALGELFDMEGVEVLRGPQGTLFGRNVTGGALTVRSARPSQEPYARLTLGVSNGLGTDASAVVNRALTPTLAARVALYSRTNDGIFTNGVDGSSFGKTYTYIVRPSVKWEPSSDFDVTLLGEYYNNTGDPVAIRGVSPNTVRGGPLTRAEMAGYISSPDYSVVQPGDRGFTDVNVYFGMAEANLNIGPGTLTSITGYRKVSSRNQADIDGFPVNAFLQNVNMQQHQFSEELRYAADLAKWLSVTAGGYYFDQHFNYKESRDLDNHATRVAANAILDNMSYAFFAEADLKPIENVTLTLGGRYTHEEKDPKSAAFGSCPFTFATPCTFTERAPYKGNNFSPKVGLSYQIDQNKLVFANWTRGFRSGGFSLRGTPLGAPYQAETVNAYEGGIKTDWLDHRLRFNLSGYYNKYENLQRTVLGVDPVLGLVQAVFNAANADIKGVEVELTVLPVNGLTIATSYGHTKAKYKSFAGFPNPGALKFVRVPSDTANITGDYETQVNDRDKVALHLGASYTGKFFYDDANLLSQKGYWLVDANVAYTIDDQFTITAWTRNLLDKNYGGWGSTLGVRGQNIYPGDPRTYGLRLTATFR